MNFNSPKLISSILKPYNDLCYLDLSLSEIYIDILVSEFYSVLPCYDIKKSEIFFRSPGGGNDKVQWLHTSYNEFCMAVMINIFGE